MGSPSRIPPIAEAEWQVMRTLWERSPRAAADVTAALEPVTGWKPQTVKTLLSRLVTKGAVGFTAHGKTYLYHPLVAEADCARAESKSFLSRVFGGALAPMVAHLVEHRDLTPEQIAELRALLDRAESECADRGQGGAR